MPDLKSEWIALATEDGSMAAYIVRSSPRPRRAVVVLQEAFGVNEHILDVTGRFAARGYLALAPDLFHRTGPKVVAYDDRQQAMALISALGPEQIRVDLAAVSSHLAAVESIEAEDTAIVGFCFGGRAAFTAATVTPGLGAAVVFYGPGIAAGPHAVLDRVGDVTAPMLMHVGADDPTIPPDQVDDIDRAARASGRDLQQVVYPEAGHAFACDARPHMYRPAAAVAAWERTFHFLDTHLPAA